MVFPRWISVSSNRVLERAHSFILFEPVHSLMVFNIYLQMDRVRKAHLRGIVQNLKYLHTPTRKIAEEAKQRSKL